ncbi:endonuclease/exonuclease/phosphatase [Streptomyces sp. NPDC127068]|uniref:endonuclease/exonuclease/phosphatase n=1 Tax=Streptomyces sp. NPDC127068 TaxID=3347127 RepID=UPI00364CE09C
MNGLGVLTFNLNNPGRDRAERQLVYLTKRPEQVLVLTETAGSVGCDLLAERFTGAGYDVVFPRPQERGERGVMVVSRLKTRPALFGVDYLPHRVVAVTVDTDRGPLDVIGLYVPSRNATQTKIDRKVQFLEACRDKLPSGFGEARVVLGDFNILEPHHKPGYRFFQPFEYEFYDWFARAGYVDAFRSLHPDAAEYSWVGRTGDGYRYEHAHVSTSLASHLRGCAYVHEPRTMPQRLTDHSALSVQLAVAPVTPVPTTTPAGAADATPSLF